MTSVTAGPGYALASDPPLISKDSLDDYFATIFHFIGDKTIWSSFLIIRHWPDHSRL